MYCKSAGIRVAGWQVEQLAVFCEESQLRKDVIKHYYMGELIKHAEKWYPYGHELERKTGPSHILASCFVH